MSAHAEAHDLGHEHHGPPAANVSSGVDARVLLPTFQVQHALRRLLPSFGRGRDGPLADALAGIPGDERRVASWGIVKSQMPNHDPTDQPLPPFAARWLERYARGDDVARWYSSAPAR